MEDKYYLITGASSGIGRATVEKLSNCGARCILVARDMEKLDLVRQSLAIPENHIIIPYDLTDLEHFSDLFGRIRDQKITLKGMVHCAGITKVTPLRTLSQSQIMELFNIHFFAFIELVKWYAKKGVSNGGSIVGISAINAHVPQKCMTAYASAKMAVEGACKTLSVELAEKGIRINSIVVGGISGGMGSDIKETVRSLEKISNEGNRNGYGNPVDRQLLGIGNPKQIADAIYFLLSEQSSFITGREMYVDGGLL